MQLVTTVTVRAAVSHVWQVFTSPQLTGDCMPGLLRWETVEPNQRFELLVAWGDTGNGSGLRIPATVEWRDLVPHEQMVVVIEVRLGSGTVGGSAQVRLSAQAPAETAVDIVADIKTPNPLLQPMVHNAAGRLLPALLRCLRDRAESRQQQERQP